MMNIGNRLIGDGEPCFIIAEAGINHNGDMGIARKLIDAAASAGADAVKFQLRNLGALYPASYVGDGIKSADLPVQHTVAVLKETQLSADEMIELAGYAEQAGIMFLCTAWDKPSARRLSGIVPAFKVASADLTNLDLLGYLSSFKLPLIVSTGMSTPEEIEISVKYLKDCQVDFSLLHCNSTYPTPFEDINLNFMTRLMDYHVPVGYSGHERGIAVSIAAVARGASIIERHLTLDRTMKGPDQAASLEPQGFKNLVRDIRHVEQAFGTGTRTMTQGERLNRETLGKSLIAIRDIHIGDTISLDTIGVKSPGKGVSPQRKYDLVGKIANRPIGAETFFLESDITMQKAEANINFQFKRPWGLIVRPHDIMSLSKLSNPDLYEFHLSARDLDNMQISYPRTITGEVIVHAPEMMDNNTLFDLCSFDDLTRDKSIDMLERVIEVARDLGDYFNNPTRTKVIIHAGGFSMDQRLSSEEQRKAIGRLKLALTLLNQDEVEILIENMPPYPWLFGGQRFHNIFVDPHQLVSFCEDQKYRICLDLSHAQLACNASGNMSLRRFIEIVKPFVAHIHVSDACGVAEEGLQIGDGEINFRASAYQLRLDYFPASFVPEIWQGHKDNGAGFMKALIALEKAGW